MEEVTFIPKTKDQIARRNQGIGAGQKSITIFSLMVLVPSALIIVGIYVYTYVYLERDVARLDEMNEEFKTQHQEVLPSQLEVGEFLGSMQEVLSKESNFAETYFALKPYFLSSLVLTSISFQGSTRTIILQSSIDTFDLAGQQLSRLRESSVVLSAEFIGQQAVNTQTGKVDITIEVRLK